MLKTKIRQILIELLILKFKDIKTIEKLEKIYKYKLIYFFKLLNQNLLLLIVYLLLYYAKVVNKKITRNLDIFNSLNLLSRVSF